MKLFFLNLFFNFLVITAAWLHPSLLLANESPSPKSIEQLSQSNTWKALLHFYNGQFSIDDSDFYFSKQNRTLSSELNATLQEFIKDHNQVSACRFPARYFWLQQHFALKKIDFSTCTDLNDFIEKAPLQKMSVVFASENISQPTSMMGHIFLKISGTNSKSIPVDHALSFFTEINDINLPKLAFESLVIGKKGYYALSPYQAVADNYLFLENRNIWEYEINLNDFEKRLMHLHFFELKKINLTYFFHSFNCATLVYQFLAIADPAFLKNDGLWVSPLDVVRKAEQQQIIQSTQFLASSRWKIKAIQDSFLIPSDEIQNIKNQKFSRSYCSSETDLNIAICHLAKTYNDYLLESNKINLETWRSYKSNYFLTSQNLENKAELDFSNYKKPTNTKPDSQVRFSNLMTSKEKQSAESTYILSFLPASHQLADDTSAYLSESELKLFDINLAYANESKRLYLKDLTFYSAKAFNPHDSLIGGLSGILQIRINQQYDEYLKAQDVFSVQAGAGKTFRLLKDVDFYLIPQLGFGTNLTKSYLYLIPETGLIVREILNMKSILSYQKTYNQFDSKTPYDLIQITQALNKQNWSVQIDLKKYFNPSHSIDEFQTTFSYLF